MIEMYTKVAIFSLSFILLASSALMMFPGTVGASPPNGTAVVTDWSGYLTIYPDGSLSDASAPVIHSGYNYTLTANITGTITVEFTGANLNGNGYVVTNNVGISPITISQANSVLITNFTLYSWYAADVNIVYSSNDTITGNTIYAMVAGVYVYSPYNEVSSNMINVVLTKSGYNGVSSGVMVKGSGTSVMDNQIQMNQTGYGVVLDTGLSNAIGNNIQFTQSDSAGVVSTGASNTIHGNIINGTGGDSYGINLQSGTQDSSVYNNGINITGVRDIGIQVLDGLNTVHNNSINVSGQYTYGIVISSSGTGSNKISDNSILDTGTGSVGIYDTSQESRISGNAVSVTGYLVRGISISNPGYVTFNTVTNSGNFSYGISALDSYVAFNSILSSGNYTSGLYVASGSYGEFVGNNINATGYDAYGVQLNGQHQTLDGNAITAGFSNGYALYEKSLIQSIISNNSLVNTTTGLQSTTFSNYNNTYVGNYIYNDSVAFRILGTSSNLLYHNSFINYTSYTVTGSAGNATWDNGYPSGGNYWYTYQGADVFSGPSQNITGSDGIGDTPFNVTTGNIDHYPLMKAWKTPTITFTETGLPTGSVWSVTFNSVLLQASEGSMVFQLTVPVYATYGFTVHPVQGYTQSISTGNVDYNGSNLVVDVVFTQIPAPPPLSYNVVFSQTGLPAGTTWSVELGGITQSSTGTSITFDPVNGTYSYTISGISGYRTGSHSGTIVVSGSDVLQNIVFTQVTYSVSFHTDGLPSGMTWYVNLSNGASYSSTSSIISFVVPNGTYSYTVNNVGDYNSTPSSGSISVAGSSPASVAINFTKAAVIPPPETGSSNLWPYIIGIIIGGAVVGTAATIIYYVRRR